MSKLILFYLDKGGVTTNMLKGFKIRIYPTKEQEDLIYKHINQCRFIWNYMLNVCNKRHQNNESYLGSYGLIKLIKPLKQKEEYKWLYETSGTSQQIVCQDLDKTFQKLFNHTGGYPKFKSKKTSELSYPVCTYMYFQEKCVHIQKLGKVKYKTDLQIPFGKNNNFKNPRISNKLGKWFLTFSMECENQALPLTKSNIGIDLGIKELAVCVYNNEPLVFHNINKSKKVKDLRKRIVSLQRSISRKYEANKQENKFVKTNNIIREERKLRKLYAKVFNINDNYIHQTTSKIIKLLPKRVIMEDLNIQGMIKNHHLAKAIQEQNFYKFISYMKYKCEWNGIEFIRVPRFYPSSKICSSCGTINTNLKLSDRVYKCECGLEIDRDFNAAINLSRYVV